MANFKIHVTITLDFIEVFVMEIDSRMKSSQFANLKDPTNFFSNPKR